MELPDEIIRHCISRLRLQPFVLKINDKTINYKDYINGIRRN